MKYTIAFILATCIVALQVSAVEEQETSPQKVIEALFDAMRAGDKEALLSHWVEGASLRRVTSKGEVKGDALPRWSEWVGTLDQGAADEKIFDLKVTQFGNLATVWAPFTIHFNGKLVGCGVNTFILAKPKGKNWKIVSGMDTDHKGDCAEYGPSK
ncbi:hypothetical protein QGN29_00010 [Temperatibacter marinus]|uniref:DUF4440 domain-containing protein n=1 Tax=Temperatibacter marinus TaxID=1456591 RepID=A0AA52H9P8_9PROT|nr:hypothetical protein [Temperatibacter marinus]WND02752.1 hypothetical protein QGN29_00010 [Temperatibacter marinus]